MCPQIVFVALVALASARPDSLYSSEQVAIIRDDRVNPSAAGEYSFNVETADGMKISV